MLELLSRSDKFEIPMWAMEALLTKDKKEIAHRFCYMYRGVIDVVTQYLNEMTLKFGDVPERKSSQYSWTAQRGRDFYYTQICRDLMDKMGAGIYKQNAFLPSEAVLASQYGVCISTVRKALDVLNQWGVTQTYNAKGTKVIPYSGIAAIQCMKNKTYKRDTLIYLSALQFMAITIKPAAILAFGYIDEKEKQLLREPFQIRGAAGLNAITNCIIERLPLQPLKTILQEIKKLLFGGYYPFYSDGSFNFHLLYQKSWAAFTCLCDGNSEDFARQLFECYSHILNFTRDFIVKWGVLEANRIITPSPDIDSYYI